MAAYTKTFHPTAASHMGQGRLLGPATGRATATPFSHRRPRTPRTRPPVPPRPCRGGKDPRRPLPSGPTPPISAPGNDEADPSYLVIPQGCRGT